MLRALRELYGARTFDDAYRSYTEAWAFKHPYPYDFFNHFETQLGDDLDWLWTSALFDTWTVDHAIESVEESSEGVRVTVRDLGLAPMPALVTLTYADGRVVEQAVPVQTWLEGAREMTLLFPGGDAVRVELDPNDALMDTDRANNTWTDEGEVNSDG